MLAQLKTVVLIKEAKQLAFFRLVEYLEHISDQFDVILKDNFLFYFTFI